MRTAHLADDVKSQTTFCGEPWEDWQDPRVPTDEEIGMAELPFMVQRAVRKSDALRRAELSTPVRQCQACRKAAMRLDTPTCVQ